MTRGDRMRETAQTGPLPAMTLPAPDAPAAHVPVLYAQAMIAARMIGVSGSARSA